MHTTSAPVQLVQGSKPSLKTSPMARENMKRATLKGIAGGSRRPFSRFLLPNSALQATAGRSHDAVTRVYDSAGNVIDTHEHKGDFKAAMSDAHIVNMAST